MATAYYKMHMDETLQKGIYGGQVQDLAFLTKVSTTKHDLFDVGDVVVLPDGREFRYAKSDAVAAMEPDAGCNFTDTGLTSYTAFAVSYAVGTREIQAAAATHAALSKDDLKGGYIIVFNGSADNDVTYGIIGNDASAQNAAITLTLDMPLGVAIVAATSACEIYKNPWGSVGQANTDVLPRCGAPVVKVSAAANYFWLQTKGIKFISPQANVGNDNGGLLAHWRHDGSIQKGETALTATVPAGDTNQPAGTVIAGSQSGNGPLINLWGY